MNIFDKHLVDVHKEYEEFKKMALQSFKDFFSDCDTRGMEIIDTFIETHFDFVLIFELEQWEEEKDKNLYSYTLAVVNRDGEVVYDEADGELPLPRVLGILKHFNCYDKV